MWTQVLIKLGVAGLLMGGISIGLFLLSWAERKQSALIQDRIGANRAKVLGIRALGEHLREKFGIEAEFIDVPNPV